MKLRRKINRGARIEILPLIDIVFLLLVFFIYAMLSMAVHRALPVRLPSSSTAELDKKAVLAITVTGDGRVFLDKKPIFLDGLTDALKAATAEKTEASVQVFAERELTYQQLFLVLDRIKQSGIRIVSLQATAED